jgi:hypothetical protein
MRRLLVSFTRGLFIVVVAVTLSVPAVYAAPREKGGDSVGDRMVRVIRRVISIVCGDDLSEPKPAPTTTT